MDAFLIQVACAAGVGIWSVLIYWLGMRHGTKLATMAWQLQHNEEPTGSTYTPSANTDIEETS